MKSEMDAMKMDERERLHWLRANRLTLIIVGIVWIGMIAWEFLHNETPLFLIAMVPVFALIRLAGYKLCKSRG